MPDLLSSNNFELKRGEYAIANYFYNDSAGNFLVVFIGLFTDKELLVNICNQMLNHEIAQKNAPGVIQVVITKRDKSTVPEKINTWRLYDNRRPEPTILKGDK